MGKNTISVIIPTHNRKDYLRSAIESVLAQTYKDIEIIVVDDGSTDGTPEIANEYEKSIKYYRQENLGASTARNLGIEKAEGEFVAFLDDDDLFLPEKLERQISILNNFPEIVLVASQACCVDQYGQISKDILVFDRTTNGLVPFEDIITTPHTSIAPSSCLFRKHIFNDIGFFDSTIRFCEDWDLIIRTGRNHNIYYINEPLVCMRVHNLNRFSDFLLNNQKALMIFIYHLKVIKKASHFLKVEEYDLKLKALSLIYGEMAINDIANQNVEEGRVYFRKAKDFNKDTWNWSKNLEKNVVQYSRALLKEKSLQDSMKFIETTLNVLFQPTPNVNRQIRKYQGNILADAAFLSSAQGKYTSVLPYALKALWYEPKLLRNRGLISISLASLFNFSSVGEMKKELFHLAG